MGFNEDENRDIKTATFCEVESLDGAETGRKPG
jgi:hypothetical protein